jgi:hypothetical protein
MREIQIGDKTIRVRATPLALLFYKQEFNSDLIGDLMSMQNMANDPSQFDALKFLQLIWAMAKADNAKDFPSFEMWLAMLDAIDFADADTMAAVVEEATDGFFRGGRK